MGMGSYTWPRRSRVAPRGTLPYVIERRDGGRNEERFVDYDEDAALLKAVRDALNGEL